MDSENVSVLFCKYGDDVFRLALSYLKCREDAEDVCQNVFLKLLSKNVTLTEGKEKSFLLTCTANACKNHLKSFFRCNVVELTDVIYAEDGDDLSLIGAVMSLPSKYSAVLHLYYYEGYDQREIGEILNISVSAVQTRMSRAKIMLKKELERNER